MQRIFVEKSIIVSLFVIILVTFSFADQHSKRKLEQLNNEAATISSVSFKPDNPATFGNIISIVFPGIH